MGYKLDCKTTGTTQTIFSIYFINPTTGWATGANGTIIYTTNSGTNWTAQTSGVNVEIRSVHFPLNSTIGWAAGSNGTILFTTNSGTNWNSQTSGTSVVLRSICFINFSTGWIAGHSGTILKTSNAGTNWVSQLSNVTNFLYSTKFADAQTGWTVGSGGKVYVTTNGGTNWSLQTTGSSSDLYSVSFINSSTGWISGQSGLILKTTDGGGLTGITSYSNEIPTSYVLYQNYPNPFNPVTNIVFSIPQRETVKLTVYDVLGSEARVLVDQTLSAGTYIVSFDASEFSSGVYFYRLEAGTFIDVKKMILIK